MEEFKRKIEGVASDKDSEGKVEALEKLERQGAFAYEKEMPDGDQKLQEVNA